MAAGSTEAGPLDAGGGGGGFGVSGTGGGSEPPALASRWTLGGCYSLPEFLDLGVTFFGNLVAIFVVNDQLGLVWTFCG